ncbi:MAG: hypothetical protein KDD94_11695 [Calditrichaeota bacterium]|nr:hypothetical protein [Calditrichota bacterium]
MKKVLSIALILCLIVGCETSTGNQNQKKTDKPQPKIEVMFETNGGTSGGSAGTGSPPPSN